ncbi:hypothetical protein BD414DRAFT_503903 [Trametes punicea]|nr:hypothetical protein BD414DRAFT_503903 [Trametes punicea]
MQDDDSLRKVPRRSILHQDAHSELYRCPARLLLSLSAIATIVPALHVNKTATPGFPGDRHTLSSCLMVHRGFGCRYTSVRAARDCQMS